MGSIDYKDPAYKEKTDRDFEVEEMNFKKLKYDVKNAERVYKSYWFTFFIAIVSFIISIVLLTLRIKGK